MRRRAAQEEVVHCECAPVVWQAGVYRVLQGSAAPPPGSQIVDMEPREAWGFLLEELTDHHGCSLIVRALLSWSDRRHGRGADEAKDGLEPVPSRSGLQIGPWMAVTYSRQVR